MIVLPRPAQVQTAVMLMYASGVVGMLMLFTVAVVNDPDGEDAEAVLLGLTGCFGPALHVTAGILGIFVLRGNSECRVAAFAVAGTSAICDGLGSTVGFTAAGSAAENHIGAFLAFYGVLAACLMAADAIIVGLLAQHRVNAWFAAHRALRLARHMPPATWP
ncbi:hypothetical protein AB0I28_00015 [Phytomonospora sp. NPDC050363]|uniref:hypothetical protein n=1 Tax=Phytomonospora sp. NPDC050363 TaxID=3155642 RepID=UPI0033C1FAF1